MRKICLLLVAVIVSISASAQTQKIAYIYSEQVFTSMAEYDSAVAALEQCADEAGAKAESMLKEVQTMYQEYKNSSSYLSDADKTSLRNKIVALEKEANEYEEKTITAMQDELMEPLEQKVMAAVNAVAEANGYDMVFDLSVANISIYQKAALDITSEVISKLK